MHLPAIVARQFPTPPRSATDTGGGVTGGAIAAIIVGSLLAFFAVLYFVLRYLRRKYPNPRFLPGKGLKGAWQQWHPTAPGFIGSRNSSISEVPGRRPGVRSGNPSNTELTRQEIVDRHTSVRSIMTLPTYQQDARPNEKILGREGDRGGIDVVVEFPETVEEEETRRDEEMESLYQIRNARREERLAREERRRLRQEARQRGDNAELARLREQRRQEQRRAEADTSAQLIRDHNNRDRRARLASVSYADVGVARHDGSRIRADSSGSDNLPLLENASTMGSSLTATTTRPSTGNTSRRPFLHHLRTRSSTSLNRVVTPADADISDDEGGRSSAEGTPWEGRSRNISRVTLAQTDEEGDLGRARLTENPPDYDRSFADLGDAPPYESPSIARLSQRLSRLLPSIEVTASSPTTDRRRTRTEADLESGPEPHTERSSDQHTDQTSSS